MSIYALGGMELLRVCSFFFFLNMENGDSGVKIDKGRNESRNESRSCVMSHHTTNSVSGAARLPAGARHAPDRTMGVGPFSGTRQLHLSAPTRRTRKVPEHHSFIIAAISKAADMSDDADIDNALNPSDSEGTEGTLRGESDSEGESEDSDAGKGGGAFFDIEAADSEDGESSEGESGSEASNGGEDVEPLFPRFMYLPPELRRRVWEFFCPEVLGMPRILEFVWDMASKNQSISEGSSTENVTEASRALAAVNCETREIALRAFPEVLRLSDRRGEMRFSAYWDIVMLQHVRLAGTDQEWRPVPRFSTEVYNLAINLDTLSDMPSNVVESLVTTFPNLRTLYPCFPLRDFEAETKWVASDKVHRFTLRTVDDTAGLMRQEERLYTWPDLLNHEEFAVDNVGPEFIKLGKIWPILEGDEALDEYPAEMWPMVEWTQDDPSEYDHDLDVGFGDEVPLGTQESQGYDSDELDEFADPLGYASGEMDSEEDLDRYEDDFVVHDGLVEYDEENSDDLEGESGAEGTDEEHGHPTFDHPGAYTLEAPAEFSDLEPDSEEETRGAGGQESGDEESDESGARRVPVRSRPRRAVISEDEDEGDEDDKESSDEDGDVRQASARNPTQHTVISDDEDEDEDGSVQAPTERNRSRTQRTVISDDEDDNGAGQARVGRRGRRTVISEDEDDEE